MDNLSHSLAGLACGEIIHRCIPSEQNQETQRLRHRMLLIACWLSSNFPDLDLVLTPLLPEPLGYLLHHRGHTHTLLYAVPQGIVIYILMMAAWPAARRLTRTSVYAHMGLLLGISFSLLLHLAMDYLNSYGIHPFHPFDSRWFYGDAVFILEPVFWIVFGVPLIGMLRSSWLKGLFLALLAAILLYFTLKQYLLWSSFLLLALIGAVLGSFQRKSGTHGVATLLAGTLLGLSFIAIQGFASNQAKAALKMQLGLDTSTRVMVDSIMTPFPANPFCWTFIAIESSESAGTYSLRHGWLSLSARILPVDSCPASMMPAQTALTYSAPGFLFGEHYEGSLTELRQLRETNCHIEAWLRFARAPVINRSNVADMRFLSSARGNFTTMHFKDFLDQACAQDVPEWDFPRRDLLEGKQD